MSPLPMKSESNSPDSINSNDSIEAAPLHTLTSSSSNPPYLQRPGTVRSDSSSSYNSKKLDKQFRRRRKHKNSKLGCPTCKKRRVKCTEDLPSCSNCIKHSVKCGYLDYTEEQLEELRQAKLDNQFDDLCTTESKELATSTTNTSTPALSSKPSLDGSKYPHTKTSKSFSVPSSSAKSMSLQPTKSASISDPPSTNSTNIESVLSNSVVNRLSSETFETEHSSGTSHQHHLAIPGTSGNSDQSLHHPQVQASSPNIVMDTVLGFQQQSVTQVYDNLLNTSQTDENPIIYPVYSLNDNFEDTLGSLGTNPYFIPSRDVFHSGAYNNIGSGELNNSLMNPLSNSSTPKFQNSVINNFVSSTSAGITNRNSPVITTRIEKGLPGAKSLPATFDVLRKDEVDYAHELMSLLKVHGPEIANGTAALVHIRDIYYTWLNSFVFRSFSSDLMFSCLLNLTTNYLISNCFDNGAPDSRIIKTDSNNLEDVEFFQQHEKVRKFSLLIEKSRLKNTAIVKSIKHYAKVIKDLRYLLNENNDPELCASVSYILSLMAIYDPEATLNSILCFRDGLFSILSYNLNLSIKNNRPVPVLIPVHLRLMKNTVRSVYLPGYDPSFLIEYSTMLDEFDKLVQPAIQKTMTYTLANNLPPREALRFVGLKLKDLIGFVKETIDSYIPTLTHNLSNLKVQQEVLFEMIHRWVRLFPSRLSIVGSHTEPLEQVLYLFHKAFKKALFAIFPQTKYFFLRDFDSPIMSDVFTQKDVNIYLFELENPQTMNLLDELYAPLLPSLKSIAAYLIRLSSFLQRRLNILYRTIVYEESSVASFPIDDMRVWRESIHDIQETRRKFNSVVGVHEVPIKCFRTTRFERFHFPIRVDSNGIEIPSPATDQQIARNQTHINHEMDIDIDIDIDIDNLHSNLGAIDSNRLADRDAELGQLLTTGFFKADYDPDKS